MNANQEAFLREFLRTGDKIKAYQAAYPRAKESSIKNAVNRLLQNNPDIAAAVNAKRAELYTEAEAEAKAKIEADIMSQLEAKQLLTQTARCRRTAPKVWHTRTGFVTHAVHPSHAQMLSAIRQIALMEGWYVNGRVGAKKEKEQEKGPTKINICIGKLPIQEYEETGRATLAAYHDPEDGRWFVDPDSPHQHDHFLSLQKKREERKNSERDAMMTPQMKREEKEALRELQSRPADQSLYQDHRKLVEGLYQDYINTGDPEIKKRLTPLQKMCGLRFLHHRHRYEAEQAAGWQFHPLNHALIRPAANAKFKMQNETQSLPVPQVRDHSDPVRTGEESAEPMQAAQSVETGKSAIEQTSVSTNLRFRQENRQQPNEVSSLSPLQKTLIRQQPTTTERSELMSMQLKNNKAMRITSYQDCHSESRTCGKESPEPMQAAESAPPRPKATTLEMLRQGYTHLNNLLQDEYDYYLRNQGSTTWQQLNNLRKFASHRNSPPEIKKQIEQETGWLYHPDEPLYAKRQPGRPLVRTKFPGPPGTNPLIP